VAEPRAGGVRGPGPDCGGDPCHGCVVSGGGSYDSDGDSLMTDDWLLTSVPAGSTAVINNLAGVNPTFDLVGNLRSAAYRK